VGHSPRGCDLRIARAALHYLWIRRAYNTRAALIASALMAVGFWPLFLSRVGLRAASVPMMSALSAWLLFEGMERIQYSEDRSQKRRAWSLVRAAGVALGLALYTYPAARTLPIVFLLFWITTSFFSRKINQLCSSYCSPRLSSWRAGLHHCHAPQADVRLQQLGGQCRKRSRATSNRCCVTRWPHWGCSTSPVIPSRRYNLPGRPVFDAITGVLFLLGVLLALRTWRAPRSIFALLWLVIGLLPSMLSDSAPSFLRASASLPVAFLFPALAIDWLLSKAVTTLARSRFAGRAWAKRRSLTPTNEFRRCAQKDTACAYHRADCFLRAC